ncbi:MAG: hypothetical protein K0V04_46055 [Deltaproteobacteria bacterium]|nr:hypothetical protein [Deltaproteobacteria bacterium]
MRLPLPLCPLVACLLIASNAGCAFDSELADRVAADVVVDSGAIVSAQTDLGYRVELSRCRVALNTVEFTTDGEQHASLLGRAWDLMVPSAYAHPGHYGGGEVVGELSGRHVFDWRDDGAVLGQATLLDAEYSGANFGFTRARAEDGLHPDDPIIGHTFEIAGVATLDGERWEFSALLDQDDGRRVVGLPLSLDVDPGAGDEPVLGLQLHIADPFEQDSLFDGVDFEMLDEDGDHIVVIEPETEAYNRLRRNTQAHDHYGVAPL